MQCLNCEPSISPSQEGKRLIELLRRLNYSFIFFILFKFLIGDSNGFLNDLLVVLLVYLTYKTIDYFKAAITIFLLIFQTIFYIASLMLIIQNSFFNIIDLRSAAGYLLILVIVISLLFYMALIYFLFLAYKEFKAIYLEEVNSSNNYRKNYFYFFRQSY